MQIGQSRYSESGWQRSEMSRLAPRINGRWASTSLQSLGIVGQACHVVALFTDFGLHGPYTPQMKGGARLERAQRKLTLLQASIT